MSVDSSAALFHYESKDNLTLTGTAGKCNLGGGNYTISPKLNSMKMYSFKEETKIDTSTQCFC